MNLFGGLGGLKTKLKGMYQANTGLSGTSTEYEGNNLELDDLQHTLHILQDENKILKNKVRLLENSVLGNDDKNSTQSHFSNLFKDLKSTFTYSQAGDTKLLLSGTGNDSNPTVSEFKKFLCDNILFYNSIDEDDVEYLNNINISGDEWEKNKDLFLFKQKILEKNYNEMFKNMTVAKDIDDLHRKKYAAVEGGKNISNLNNQNYDDLKRLDEVNNIVNNNLNTKFDKNNINNDLNGASQFEQNMPSTKPQIQTGVTQPTKTFENAHIGSKTAENKEKIYKELKQKEIENFLLKDLINVTSSSKDDDKFNISQNSVNGQQSQAYKINKEVPSIVDNKFIKKPETIDQNDHISSVSIKNENSTRTNDATFNNLLNLDEEEDNIDISSVLKKIENKKIEKYENINDEEKVVSNIFNFRNSATNDKILNTNTISNINSEKKILIGKQDISKKDENFSENLLSSNFICILYIIFLDLLLGKLTNSDSSVNENKSQVKDLFILSSKKIENIPSNSDLTSQKQNTNQVPAKTTKYAWDEDDLEDL